MGEIGISRHEFYYELKWWEVKAIIRGYHARHHHSWEQARLVAYHARYCMGSKDPVPTPEKWLPFTWELKAEKIVSDAERQDLQAEMDAISQQLAE